MALGVKMQLINKKELEEEYSSYLDSLSKKYNLNVKIDAASLKVLEQQTNKSTEAQINQNKSLQELIHLRKTLQLDAQQFIQLASKYRQEENFVNLTKKEQVQLVRMLTTAEKEHSNVLNSKSKILSTIDAQKKKEEELNITIRKQIDNYKELFTIKSQALVGKYGSLVDSNALNNLQTKVSGINIKDFNKEDLKAYNIEFEKIKTNAINSSKAIKVATQDARSFGDEIVRSAKKFAEWLFIGTALMQTIRFLKSIVTTVIELDDSITDLKKVSSEIGNTVGIKEFLTDVNKLAIEVGHNTKAAIDSITDFKRLGYSLQESQVLAKQALIYSNISDQSIEDATQSIISTLKGFQLGVEDVNHVMDAYNEVGNNFQITSAGIGAALQRSSAALYEAGNTLEQSIGLITAANSSIQNPEKVGNGLICSPLY